MEVRDLTVSFPVRGGEALAVDRVAFDVWPGEMLGIVGESGCGKSVSLRAVMDLVPHPGEILAGQIVLNGKTDLRRLDSKRRRAIRGSEISMVFQDPGRSLDPLYTVGDQLVEVLRLRGRLARGEARTRAVELLGRVGIPAAASRFHDYPHQLSGGQLQRAVIASAIATSPKLLLADEPTTALDVTIQDQILALLADLQQTSGLSIVLVSHDLGVIAQSCDRVVVMYAGRVVEAGLVDQVLDSPRHPYTAALIAAAPRRAGRFTTGNRLEPIAGIPPSIGQLPQGCTFAPRCAYAVARCAEVDMNLDENPSGHASACPVVDLSAERGRT